MDSGRSVVDWADLPAELLAMISEKFANCREILRFRSVCPWWRISTPPPPNKLSGIFPLKPSFLPEHEPFNLYVYGWVINASAIYLVSKPPPSTSVSMVCLQEASPGKLVLRDPLWHREILNSDLDANWIAATQTPICRSYAHYKICSSCKQPAAEHHATFVRESSGSGCSQLVGLCAYPIGTLYAFRMELSDDDADSTATTIAAQFYPSLYHDIVAFNGRIFAADSEGLIYLLDPASLKLVRMNTVTKPCRNCYLNFVVSNGELYMVCSRLEVKPVTCEVYRLRVVVPLNSSTAAASDNPNQISLVVEKVEDLGDDTVFFIGTTRSFSVSARDLPPPWKGNCIVFSWYAFSCCKCKHYGQSKIIPDVFSLGRGQEPQSVSITSLQGYSDLFPACFSY